MLTPMPTLGALTRLEPRDAWASEAQDFTPWLATETGLELLGDAIGLELALEGSEARVGPFRADIVARDTATDAVVIVENQLERTDHSHLGQLITYAAGLQAGTIVWIAHSFTEEHRAALDWLNLHTDEDISFFGLEIELWRIGDSAPAPKLNVICKPNDWTKAGNQAKSRSSEETSETKEMQREFWTALKDHLTQQKSQLRPQLPRPQHWYVFSIGRTGAHLSAIANTAAKRVEVKLVINSPSAKSWFAQLLTHKAEVETRLGTSLDWDEKPAKRSCDVSIGVNGFDISDRDSWDRHLRWLTDYLERFKTVFTPLIQGLHDDVDEP